MINSPLPAFSVLMSVYKNDDTEHFYAAFESVLNQTLLPDEIVLVKDGPVPPLLDFAIQSIGKIYPILKIIELPINLGLGAALDIGLSNCSHEIVARMDSDDISAPNRFEIQVKEISSQKKISVLGSWVGEFNLIPGKIDVIKKVPLDQATIFRYAKFRCPVNHPSVVFRKSHVQAVGGYSSRHLQEDYFLWARLLAAGYLFKNIPEILVFMRTGSGLYNRRGGLKYAIGEIKLFFDLYKLGFIGPTILLFNLLSRGVTRMLPPLFRKYIYHFLLRSRMR
jgi:glycosyltransferase involved in cell wall biosynthesis